VETRERMDLSKTDKVVVAVVAQQAPAAQRLM
jgi:hypothetical protein